MNVSSRSSITNFLLHLQATHAEEDPVGDGRFYRVDQPGLDPELAARFARIEHNQQVPPATLDTLVEVEEEEEEEDEKKGLEERLAKVEVKVREKFGLSMEELMDEVEDQKEMSEIPEDFLPGADEHDRKTAWMNLEAAVQK